MKTKYETPVIETLEAMECYCNELNTSSSNLGDVDGGGNEDLVL